MTATCRAAWAVMAIAGGCSFPKPDDLGVEVGGAVRGMWDGAGPLELRLRAKGAEHLVDVAANGDFTFPDEIAEGAPYEVTVATAPGRHTCAVEGGAGTAGDSDVTTVEVACQLAAPVAIELTPVATGWTFDATRDRQVCALSLLVQRVTVTVRGSELTGVRIGDVDAVPGQPSAAQVLGLGSNVVDVSVHADELSRTFTLDLARGDRLLEQVVFAKASNADRNDSFGYAVAMSDELLAVGARNEDSMAPGPTPPRQMQDDNTYADSGAVYVFRRDGASWVQEAYLKASNPDPGDLFGTAVALRGDTLAVGARAEDSNGRGVDPAGGQANNDTTDSGAVYVFRRVGGTWRQEAYIKASNTDRIDLFGHAVALGDNVLAVNSRDDSRGTGVDSPLQDDNTALESGAVYVFRRVGTTWRQEAYIKSNNSEAGDAFGYSLAFWGDILAVGARGEDSSAKGVNPRGGSDDDSAPDAGAVYVYHRDPQRWILDAYIKASNPGAGDEFGVSIALSEDYLAVGASSEDGGGRGLDPPPNQDDESANKSGAVYVYRRAATLWAFDAYLKASNTDAGDEFGNSVALSRGVLAVGAPFEASAAIGVNPADGEADNSAMNAGAVYLFTPGASGWVQGAYVKARNTRPGSYFGQSLTAWGETIVTGASGESRNATGVNPPDSDDFGKVESGAVYVFE